jgi:hypothetical protein
VFIRHKVSVLVLVAAVSALWITHLVGGNVSVTLAEAEVPSDPYIPHVEARDIQPPKTVIDLQPFRKTAYITARDASGQEGRATLINLNPHINTWFVLALQFPADGDTVYYHLENPRPEVYALSLDPGYSKGIVVADESESFECALWGESDGEPLATAASSGQPYSPICQGRLLLRNPTRGRKTTLETVTDLLRRHVWQGEKITALVRETFYKDAFLETASVITSRKTGAAARSLGPAAPVPPLVDTEQAGTFLEPTELGIEPQSETGNRMRIGRWYAVRGLGGIFISVIEPGLVSKSVIANTSKQVNAFDEVEPGAMVYMVAFDLDLFEMGFEMGTEHPNVAWSERVSDDVRDTTLPGPDGIGTMAPLEMTGLLDPVQRSRVAATFVGGFKRYHGAFRWSELAHKNHGSHYGFLQHGTILSTLLPALATVLINGDGSVDLFTWREADNVRLPYIRHARQNGLPIIDFDPATQSSKVGAMVPRWGQGNWSGSADVRLRTVRAGLALQEIDGRRYLIYGYFSAATPSAMARVFTAYQCKYAMQLDINALEHTYLAIYTHQHAASDQLSIQHLIKGMSVLDKTVGGRMALRFVDFPDNRDFFYLLRKDEP